MKQNKLIAIRKNAFDQLSLDTITPLFGQVIGYLHNNPGEQETDWQYINAHEAEEAIDAWKFDGSMEIESEMKRMNGEVNIGISCFDGKFRMDTSYLFNDEGKDYDMSIKYIGDVPFTTYDFADAILSMLNYYHHHGDSQGDILTASGKPWGEIENIQSQDE